MHVLKKSPCGMIYLFAMRHEAYCRQLLQRHSSSSVKRASMLLLLLLLSQHNGSVLTQ